MRQAVLAVGLAVAGLMTAAPANAAACGTGYACFYFGPGGTGRVVATHSETWHNLPPLHDNVTVIVNNQARGDDACVAAGPNGTGRTFCVDGGDSRPVPQDLIARSIRG
jgi:hypothetical protein